MPVFVSLVAALVVAQGQILAFDIDRGLAWVGFVTLAATLSRYIDRADTIVTSTIYPAICAIRDRTRALEELFVRSNRATLLWVLPACAGAVLFAGDLITFVLGDEWQPARGLIQGLAVATAMGQLGFNWFSFYRAHERTRPPAVEAVVAAVAFCALAVPGLRHRRRDAASSSAAAPRSPSSSGCARATSARCCPPCGCATCWRGPPCRPRPPRRRCWRCAARCGAQAGRRPRRSPSSRSSAPSSSC